MSKKSPLEMFEKVVLRKNKTQSDLIIENLSDLKNKSVENIRKTLEDRLTTNEGFTLAKNSLIHIESSNTKFSLLYKYIESVYKKLKTTKENQIIPLLGSSLKAKETTKNLFISHLNFLASDSETYSKFIQSSVDLLNFFGSDGENWYYAETLDFNFSEKFQLVGCKINAKITDLDLSQNCGIFRIMLSLSDPVLQHLGIGHKALSEKNIELHQKFKNNMDFLGISWTETQEIMEILAVVVLLDDVEFVTSCYKTAGNRGENEFLPDKNKPTIKICKLLGLLHLKFQEFFTVRNKQAAKEKILSFKKILLISVFEYFVNKINQILVKKAKEMLIPSKAAYKVSLTSFPNPKLKSNIDGLLSNLMIECQEFLAYESLFSILSLFNEEKVSAGNLSVPRSRYLIELFLDKHFGIIYNFNGQKF